MNEFDIEADNIFDPDNDPILEVFFNEIERLMNKSKVLILNPKRVMEFKYTFFQISEIIKSITPDAKIICNCKDTLWPSIWTIRIETDEIVVDDIKQFISSIQFCNNFEIYPINNGDIRIGIMFNDMMIE